MFDFANESNNLSRKTLMPKANHEQRCTVVQADDLCNSKGMKYSISWKSSFLLWSSLLGYEVQKTSQSSSKSRGISFGSTPNSNLYAVPITLQFTQNTSSSLTVAVFAALSTASGIQMNRVTHSYSYNVLFCCTNQIAIIFHETIRINWAKSRDHRERLRLYRSKRGSDIQRWGYGRLSIIDNQSII